MDWQEAKKQSKFIICFQQSQLITNEYSEKKNPQQAKYLVDSEHFNLLGVLQYSLESNKNLNV